MANEAVLPDSTKNIIFSLMDEARKNATKKDQLSRISAAMIYANLAEYLANKLLTIIESKINDLVKDKNLGIDLEAKNKNRRPSNLEYVMDQLKNYKFTSKHEIMSLLGTIKTARNNLFHNLLTAHEKGIDINLEINKIITNSQNLLILTKTWNGQCLLCNCKV